MVAGYFAAIYDPLSSIGIAALEPYPQPYPPNDVFVSKLDPTGKILFTAAFAGKGLDQGLAVTVDPPVISTLPGPPPRRISHQQRSAIAERRTAQASSSNSAGWEVDSLLHLFGGLAGSTSINAMTTDAAGNLYLTGTTSAIDFPHTSACRRPA